MALKTNEKFLQLSFRIPAALHDEVDAMRTAAKALGAVYDPQPALEKALRKDLATARKQIDEVKADAKSKSKD